MNKKKKIGTKIIALIFRGFLSLRYKIALTGVDVLKTNSTKLFLPNHQALIDPVILNSQIFKHSFVSPAVSDKYYENSFFKLIFKAIDAIPVSDIESGNRDANVLEKITKSSIEALENGNNIMIYPSGQIASQEFEKIKNKQGVYKLIPLLPYNVQIIGVRMYGLWGSMWSKAKTGKTPGFMNCLFKGLGLILLNLIFLTPRRKVNIEFVDITNLVYEKVKLERREFNKSLEEFYNIHGEEPIKSVRYHFLRFI